MNRELRVLESGFRAQVAGLGNWANSASGLESRIKSLTDQIGFQQQKVDSLEAEYQRLVAAKGKDSIAAQEMLIKYNKQVEVLGKMETELKTSETALQEMGEESQETGGKVEDLGKKEEDTADKTNRLADVMKGLGTALKVGVAAIAGLAAAVVGLGGAITKLVLDTAAYSAELVDLSAKTGISTTRLQELAYVGDQVGTSSDTMTSSLARMIRTMGEAKDQFTDYAQAQYKAAVEGKEFSGELGEYAQAFQDLGVSIINANGQLRNSEDVFADVIDALGNVANETERDALAMEIFGRSAMELNPLIKAGADEISRLSDEAHKVGAIMAEEDVAAMEAFDDSLSSLQAGLKGTLGTLAGAFLPAFQGMADTAQTYLGQFSEIVRGADGDLGQMASGIGDLLGQIATDLASKGPEMLQAGLGILQGVIDGIVQNLPALVEAAVQMVRSLVDFLIDNIPMLMQAGIEIIMALVNGIVPQLPKLIEMAAQMIINLMRGIAEALPQLIEMTAEIIPKVITSLAENLPLLIGVAANMIVTLIKGIAEALPQLIEQVAGIIPEIIIALINVLPQLIDAGLELIVALIEGLTLALPILIEYTPQIVEAIFSALISALPRIGEAASELVVVLIAGIVGMLPSLATAAVQLVETIYKKIWELDYKIRQVGANIVKGIWDGIAERAEWFKKQLSDFINNLVTSVKDALQMKSPSAVFANIGENMALGLDVGFRKAFSDVERNVSRAVGNMNVAVPNLAIAGAPAAGGNLDLGGVHIYVSGTADPRRIGQAAERGVLRALKAKGMA
jgi:phage-related protein